MELALSASTAGNATLVNSTDSVDSSPFCLTRATPVFAEKRLEGYAELFTKSSWSETLSWTQTAGTSRWRSDRTNAPSRTTSPPNLKIMGAFSQNFARSFQNDEVGFAF